MSEISIVIPFYNESDSITKTLDSLNKQTYQPDEVILVDSGSDDNTCNLINKWIEDNQTNKFKIIYSGKMSPSSSINLGVRNAKNNLIGYLDCGLFVPNNWIESNVKIIKQSNCDMVSVMIYTKGQNYIDKSLVAQSYGYKNKTACLTGSIIKKSIIKKLNYFLENCRASYDIDFINKFKKNNYTREVNTKIILNYYDINFSSNYHEAIQKVFRYSKNAWLAYGDLKPISYILLTVFIIIIPYNYYYNIILFYFILRGYITPYLKSKNLELFQEIPLLALLPLSGFIFDISRLAGYIYSLPSSIINDKQN
tara:strand:+ start:7038 stop:7967 length:930 start_codon:yes stop_codon:yes gene_type:complete